VGLELGNPGSLEVYWSIGIAKFPEGIQRPWVSLLFHPWRMAGAKGLWILIILLIKNKSYAAGELLDKQGETAGIGS
jgi:hypothetical protein